jgi:predicted MFS family arabinose efflux permease
LSSRFKRDGQFWYVASQLGIIGLFMGGFGPAQPLLQSDQGTSGLVAGLHGTALGLSGLLAGQLNARMVHRFGRFTTSWIGMAIFIFGVASFALLNEPVLTITASLFAGFGITTMINNSVTFLNDSHPEHSAIAISQANGFNSTMYLVGTIFIGTLASAGLGWRWGLLVTVPLALLAFHYSKAHRGEIHAPDESGPQRGRLTNRYWIGWIGFTCAIAAEFSTVFWAAALLRERFDLTNGNATTAVLCFAAGMALGRWFGVSLFPRIDIDPRTLFFVLLQLGGFLLFWNVTLLPLALLGLFATGLGASTQFTLFSTRLIRFAQDKPDLAIGMSAWGAGLAIGFAPFLVGALSDQVGIWSAYWLVPVLIASAGLSLLLRSDQITSRRK